MHYVYTLIDPRDEQVRYVGITNNLKNRFQGHLRDVFNKVKQAWIDDLSDNGYMPIMAVVEKVKDEPTARARECHWIRHYHLAGCNLLNQDLIAASWNDGHLAYYLEQLERRSKAIRNPQINIIDLTSQAEDVSANHKTDENNLLYWLAR